MVRRLTRGLALLVVLAGVALVSPAQADAFRGWSLFQPSGTSWAPVAQAGAAVPADGSVIGWRLSLAPSGSPRLPRGSRTFAQVCGDTTAGSGQKRVAVVIDYGRRVDYDDQGQPPVPRADCATVPSGATAAEALTDVARTRTADGKVCAVDDFPQSGCGDQVADADIPSAATEPDQSTSVALPTAPSADDRPRDDGGLSFLGWAAIVIVLAGGGLGVWWWRRRPVAEEADGGDATIQAGQDHDHAPADAVDNGSRGAG